MVRARRWLLLLLLLLGSASTGAVELAGVALPPRIELAGSNTPLVLNGAGVRKKFFLKIYIGALYLPRPQRDAGAILDADGPFRVTMHFLYGEVEAEAIVQSWRDGFAANLDEAQQKRLQPAIERYVGLFGTLRRDDRVWLDRLPGGATQVTINGQLAGTIDDPAFGPALLRIWLGDEPVTEALKAAMLGVE